MNLSASPSHSTRTVAFPDLSRVFALAAALLMLLAAAASAQQPVPRKSAVSQSSKPQPQFQEVEALVRQGSLDQAKQKIQDVLRQNPSSVEAHNLLGIICTEQKDFPGALDAFHHALELDPSSTRTRNNLGKVYAAQGKSDLAEKEFRAVVRLDPANRDGNYNLGLILMTKNQPVEAISRFQRVRPANLETRFNLIRAFLQAHRTAEGLKAATELSSENKDDIQLHFTLGVLLGAEKQYKPAQLELERANALRPETFELLFILGQVYLRGLEYPKAEQALNRALKLKPDSPETLYLLAKVYADQTRAVDALDLLVRAHKLAPENTDIIFLLARVSMLQNYFEDAIPLLESGLEITPQPKIYSSKRCAPIPIFPMPSSNWQIFASRPSALKKPPSFFAATSRSLAMPLPATINSPWSSAAFTRWTLPNAICKSFKPSRKTLPLVLIPTSTFSTTSTIVPPSPRETARNWI